MTDHHETPQAKNLIVDDKPMETDEGTEERRLKIPNGIQWKNLTGIRSRDRHEMISPK